MSNKLLLAGCVLTGLLFHAQAIAQVRQVDSDEVLELQKKGVVLIDVRTPDEWFETGVVPGSRLLTFFDEQGNYDMGSWLAALGHYVEYGRPFMLICDVGVRTEAISKVLSNQFQLPNVINVKDGIRGWLESGRDTVQPPMMIDRHYDNEELKK